MKITKSQLRQIIKEEINKEQQEPTNNNEFEIVYMDDAIFLKKYWNSSIEEINKALLYLNKQNDIAKAKYKAIKMKMFRNLYKRDIYNIQFKTKLLLQIKKSKEKKPEFVPSNYKIS